MSISSSVDWRKFFPLKAPRAEQSRALDDIVSAFLNGQRVVIANLGTGVGKSAIAVTLGSWFNAQHEQDSPVSPGAYVLTSQKILQDQYVKDFPGTVEDIRSSANFRCTWLKNQTCAETLRIERMLPDVVTCARGQCQYRLQKRAFKESIIGVTNYSFALSDNVYGHSMDARQLVVLDEAHSIEDNVRKFATVQIFKDRVEALNLSWPVDDSKFDSWLEKKYSPALAKRLQLLTDRINVGLSRKLSEKRLQKLTKEVEDLDKHLCQVNRYIFPKDGSTRSDFLKLREVDKIELKPLYVGGLANSLLYSLGDYKLLMSATLLEPQIFMRSVGLSNQKTTTTSIPSPFPTKNRPFVCLNTGSMSKKLIDSTLPSIAKTVESLLETHPREKGICHAATYKIAKYVKENVKSDRLLLHDSTDRDAVLKRHVQSDRPTVLLSPSMTEGIDLWGDLSRFQILCKVPYPYIGDPVVAAKLKSDPEWFAWMTAKTLVQSVGRSIRSSDDEAVTYMLDSDWVSFFRRNSKMFPKDFCDSIVEL